MPNRFSVSRIVLAMTVSLASRDLPAAESDQPLPPEQAAESIKLPPGFSATLFAGEPDVVQPIAFTFDTRGRLWVVECTSYPEWSDDGTGNDRVLILEDTDNDGRSDKRTVFFEGGSNLSGIALGFGGVWLCSVPNLIFIPDEDADDQPDGPPEILLDGWDLNARHNVFNGLTWGPDGWLYGLNGILSNSLVGAPGTPDEERTALDCGVWRYHPTRREFELYASGTTNPWGLDFDEYGRMFITNCVIEHLFQVFPGAHYKRMFGQDRDPNVYGLIQTCADHIHWGGGYWDISIGGIHDDFGGGHAHAGAMIYLGDNWPEEYRGNLFTLNIHGRRANRDSFEPHGSGVVAKHQPDFFLSGDPWFRGLELKYGPDGAVYLTDWNDTGECHDYENTQKQTGRIFRIVYNPDDAPSATAETRTVNLAEADNETLVTLQQHDNEWLAREARQILQHRADTGTVDEATVASIRQRLLSTLDEPEVSSADRLRNLWALHAVSRIDDVATELLDHDDEHVRAWTIRLLLEDRSVTRGQLLRLTELAQFDPSPVVRAELACALQRLPSGDRWAIARNLVRHEQDGGDHNIPLLLWYGVEPLAGDERNRDLKLLTATQIPLVQRYLARRIASLDDGIGRLVSWLAVDSSPPSGIKPILAGLRDATEGRRNLPMPDGWRDLAASVMSAPDESVRNTALYLSLVFGDERAAETLQRTVRDASLAMDDRRVALETLIQVPHDSLLPLLKLAVSQKPLAGPALRGLALFDDDEIPAVIISHYSRLDDSQRQEAISTLASREDYALQLLAAVREEKIKPGDVSVYVARQLRDFGNEEINRQLDQLWGSVRASSEEKRRRIREFAEQLSADELAAADLPYGRLLFTQKCANCHRLFGEGAVIGPDLTGAQRTSVDYLLQHIVDPSSAVPREYRVHTVLTTDGRLINGVVPEESRRTITLQTPTERIVLDRGNIDELKPTSLSMMPEGLLEALTPQERRDLIGYLAAPTQVPLPTDEQQ